MQYQKQLKNITIMSKRKYIYYILATEFGEEQFENYSEAFSSYNKSDSATLYGVSEDNEMNVINSK